MLEFEYFGSFDTTNTSFINDSFEVSIVDSTGRSIVPTFRTSRDSFFNLTEGENAALGEFTDHTAGTPGSGVAGVVQLGRLDTLVDRDETAKVLASYDYTVRADGKRTGLAELTWFDIDNDAVIDAGEQKTTNYTWSYDNIGRLTDEVIDHWDNNFDLKESFKYDFTGNRVSLQRDQGNNGSIDQAISYTVDVNDRLITEVIDDVVNANDVTNTYTYNQTQQTSKTVAAGAQTRSKQIFAYNLQGRMTSVVNEGYTSGTLSSRTRATYKYDSDSYRVGVVNASDNALNNTYTTTSTIEFLADAHNHTGYTQTIRETTVNVDNSSKTVDYTFGLDEISQRTVLRNAANVVTGDKTLVFGHDGHGSVTVLYDLTSTIINAVAALATYSSYGVLLATHTGSAGVHASNFTLQTSLGYSGELWDAASQQQYLRARYYNPANGRFNSLDPFAGNMQDPQSLHKYAYVHGDPVNGVDPSGNSLISISINLAFGFSVRAMAFRAGVGALLGATDWLLDDTPDRSFIGSVSFGAGFSVLGPLVPWWIGLPLAGGALWDAASRSDVDLFLFRGATVVAGGGMYRYLGGRAGGVHSGAAGNPATRTLNTRVWLRLSLNGWRIQRGGNAFREEVISRPNPVNPTIQPTWVSGGRQRVPVDVTLVRNVNGQTQTMRVQTIDTLVDGITPTAREATNARLIQEAFPNDILLLIPKNTSPGAPFSPTQTYDGVLGDVLEMSGY